MKIDVLFAPSGRLWQAHLVEALADGGHDVQLVVAPTPSGVSRGLDLAIAVETRLFGGTSSLFRRTMLPCVEVRRDGALLIAMCDAPVAGDAIVPLFDGIAGAAGLLKSVARSPTPSVDIRFRSGDGERSLVRGLLAIEHRDVFSRALDQVLARLVTLILQSVRRLEQCGNAEGTILSESAAQRPGGPGRFMLEGLARKIRGRLPRGRRGPNHWRIGYRPVGDAGLAQQRRWDTQRYAILPDDGRRFYADPFPFEHEGRSFLFFEDFPYASAKGVIGMVEIMPDGTASPPRTVLEQPVHLSYPLIIRHNDAIYMLPEMSGAGRIQLFRAAPFPDRWVPDRVLLDGLVASDATPVFHNERWWLFATLSDDGGSTWDQLGLFHAPDLLGPWTAHPDNPVLVDAGAARPAGAMWVEDGILMRVAQDCRTGYGVGLAICRVDRLDERGFAQTVVARLEPPPSSGADGTHTLNRAASLEAVDLRFPDPGDAGRPAFTWPANLSAKPQ